MVQLKQQQQHTCTWSEINYTYVGTQLLYDIINHIRVKFVTGYIKIVNRAIYLKTNYTKHYTYNYFLTILVKTVVNKQWFFELN